MCDLRTASDKQKALCGYPEEVGIDWIRFGYHARYLQFCAKKGLDLDNSFSIKLDQDKDILRILKRNFTHLKSLLMK